MKLNMVSRDRKTHRGNQEVEKTYGIPNTVGLSMVVGWNLILPELVTCPLILVSFWNLREQGSHWVTMCEGECPWSEGRIKGFRWERWIQWGKPSTLAAVGVKTITLKYYCHLGKVWVVVARSGKKDWSPIWIGGGHGLSYGWGKEMSVKFCKREQSDSKRSEDVIRERWRFVWIGSPG